MKGNHLWRAPRPPASLRTKALLALEFLGGVALLASGLGLIGLTTWLVAYDEHGCSVIFGCG
jgi:hypothetical protein